MRRIAVWQRGGLQKASCMLECWRTSKRFPRRHVGWWYFKELRLHEQRCPKPTSSSPPPTAPLPLLLICMNRTPPSPLAVLVTLSLPCLLLQLTLLTHADSIPHASLKSSSVSLLVFLCLSRSLCPSISLNPSNGFAWLLESSPTS